MPSTMLRLNRDARPSTPPFVATAKIRRIVSDLCLIGMVCFAASTAYGILNQSWTTSLASGVGMALLTRELLVRGLSLPFHADDRRELQE